VTQFVMTVLLHEAEFDAAGLPGAPVIIFLHGSSETRRMWEPQTISLADSFRTIAADLPSHGALAKIPFRMESVVEWLAQLIDREAGGRAIIAGISLGGYVAMEFAARHPEKAAALILLSCTAEPTGPGTALYFISTSVMSLVPQKLLRVVKGFVFRLLYPPHLSALVTGDDFRGGARGIRQVLGHSFIAKVRAFPGPILFVNGQRDFLFRSSERRFLAAARQGRLELVPKAYHVCNLDDPERVSTAIRRFAVECQKTVRSTPVPDA
jgi:pimeloyl-ACP methyl ester carboxylesterase